MIIDNNQNSVTIPASPNDWNLSWTSLDLSLAEAQPYLQNFCVAPKWRRKGVGRAMLRMIEEAGWLM